MANKNYVFILDVPTISATKNITAVMARETLTLSCTWKSYPTETLVSSKIGSYNKNPVEIERVSDIKYFMHDGSLYYFHSNNTMKLKEEDMGSQLILVKIKLEDRRKRIEDQKKMELIMTKQREKVGQEAFLRPLARGIKLFGTIEVGESGECEISELANRVTGEKTGCRRTLHMVTSPSTVAGGSRSVSTSDIEANSISRISNILNELQSDVQHLAVQQSQIQTLMSSLYKRKAEESRIKREEEGRKRIEEGESKREDKEDDKKRRQEIFEAYKQKIEAEKAKDEGRTFFFAKAGPKLMHKSTGGHRPMLNTIHVNHKVDLGSNMGRIWGSQSNILGYSGGMIAVGRVAGYSRGFNVSLLDESYCGVSGGSLRGRDHIGKSKSDRSSNLGSASLPLGVRPIAGGDFDDKKNMCLNWYRGFVVEKTQVCILGHSRPIVRCSHVGKQNSSGTPVNLAVTQLNQSSASVYLSSAECGEYSPHIAEADHDILFDKKRLMLLIRAGLESNPGPGPSSNPTAEELVESLAANIAEELEAKNKTRKPRGRPRSSEEGRVEIHGGGDETSKKEDGQVNEGSLCDCGKSFPKKKNLVQHREKHCPLNKLVLPVSPIFKRRQTPSPMKTPRSGGFKLQKLDVHGAPDFDQETTHTLPPTIYVKDEEAESLLSSCKYTSSYYTFYSQA